MKSSSLRIPYSFGTCTAPRESASVHHLRNALPEHPDNPGVPLDLDAVAQVRVNLSAAERRAATIPTRRTVKKEWQAAWLVKAIQCIDLTTLSGDDTEGRVERLCAKAIRPLKPELIDGLKLPDVDDRHVLATAIRCGASVIVTFNEKDFPSNALEPFGIEAQHPDAFVDYLFDLDQAAVVAAARQARANLQNPRIDVDRYLDSLLRQGLVQTSKSLNQYRSIL